MKTVDQILGTAADTYYVNNADKYGNVLFVIHESRRAAEVASNWECFADDRDENGDRVGDDPNAVAEHERDYASYPLSQWINDQLRPDSYYDNDDEKRDAVRDLLKKLTGWDDDFDKFALEF